MSEYEERRADAIKAMQSLIAFCEWQPSDCNGCPFFIEPDECRICNPNIWKAWKWFAAAEEMKKHRVKYGVLPGV